MKRKIIFIGESNSLKSKIVIESFLLSGAAKEFDVIAACHGPEFGCFVECARIHGIDLIYVGAELSSKDFPSFKSIVKDVCFVLTGWPYLVSKSFLSDFDGRVINCHGSYLPDYKGSRAYMHYWANIEDCYGVTVHYVDERFDNGNIIRRVKLKQFKEETPKMIHCRMAEVLGAILETCFGLVFSNFKGSPQECGGRYFQKIPSEDFRAVRMHNEVSGVSEKIRTPFTIRAPK